jgi:hypothetical protein
MPDFFDRLLARDARPGAGPAAAARTADLEQRAGVTRTFPRVPMMFEWPQVALTEQVTETDAAPAPPAPAGVPGVASWPAPPPGQPSPPPPSRPLPADRGPGTIVPPGHPLLVPPALAPVPAEAARGHVSVPYEEGPDTLPALAGQEHASDPSGPRRGQPDAPASRRPPPPRGPAGPTNVPPSSGVALPAGRAQRHAVPPPERVVQVRIGRIEVRPAESAEPRRPAGRAPGRAGPRLSLERFLAGEDGGR